MLTGFGAAVFHVSSHSRTQTEGETLSGTCCLPGRRKGERWNHMMALKACLEVANITSVHIPPAKAILQPSLRSTWREDTSPMGRGSKYCEQINVHHSQQYY